MVNECLLSLSWMQLWCWWGRMGGCTAAQLLLPHLMIQKISELKVVTGILQHLEFTLLSNSPQLLLTYVTLSKWNKSCLLPSYIAIIWASDEHLENTQEIRSACSLCISIETVVNSPFTSETLIFINCFHPLATLKL